MLRILIGAWTEDEGVLAFEWVLLTTLLVIGIVSGLTGARDAIIDELGDVAEAMLALDQSYTIVPPLAVNVHVANNSASANSKFVDFAVFTDCARPDGPTGQMKSNDAVGGG